LGEWSFSQDGIAKKKKIADIVGSMVAEADDPRLSRSDHGGQGKYDTWRKMLNFSSQAESNKRNI